MNRTRKETALLLAFVMILSLVSTIIAPQAVTKSQASGYGISNPTSVDGKATTWDTIYFGNYYQSDTTKTTKEPIRWRVLEVNGDDAFLVADQNLECRAYNNEWTEVTWENCTLRKWLNSAFLTTAFTTEEQGAIKNTTVVNKDSRDSDEDIDGGNNTVDKVYLLSIDEASNTAYGFNSLFDKYNETREAKVTTYAKERNVWTNTSDGYANNGFWWLRSPGCNNKRGAYIDDAGYGCYDGEFVNNNYAVRPTLHLDLSNSSLWTKGESVTVNAEKITTWDTIYFGNYYQSDATGVKKEPICWRVLSVNGDDAFVIADQNLDCQPYESGTGGGATTWETCTLRSWLNGSFLTNAFTSEEQAAISNTTVINDDNAKYGTEGGNNTIDKIFILSLEEASNAAYGFNSAINKYSENRKANHTSYTKEQGAWDDYSWLRSAGENPTHVSYVSTAGICDDDGEFASCYVFGVRPVLHLNLSFTNLWTKGNKVISNEVGKVLPTPTPGTPTPTPTSTPGTQGTPTPTPTKTPSVNAVPSMNTASTIGSIKYKVSKSATKNGTVSVIGVKNKSVKKLTVPATVQINGYVFKVTKIADKAFYNCKKLKTLTIKSTYMSTVGKNAIKNANKKLVIKVPKNKYAKYKKLFTKKTGLCKTMKIKK